MIAFDTTDIKYCNLDASCKITNLSFLSPMFSYFQQIISLKLSKVVLCLSYYCWNGLTVISLFCLGKQLKCLIKDMDYFVLLTMVLSKLLQLSGAYKNCYSISLLGSWSPLQLIQFWRMSSFLIANTIRKCITEYWMHGGLTGQQKYQQYQLMDVNVLN